jgi:hypothetical protein
MLSRLPASGAPVELGVRLGPGPQLHYFVDGRYLCSLALPDCPAADWRFVLGASSGSARILLDAPPYPPQDLLVV